MLKFNKRCFDGLNVAGSFLLAVLLGASGCTSKAPKEPPNTLRLALQAKIKGLDPAFADDLYAGTEVSRAYEGLFQYHYLKRPYVLVPNLAEAMPQVSADGKMLTIKLKKGVLFQDDSCFKETGGKGRELVAEDVIYSFKRLADPKLASTGWWVFDGKIAGLNEWHDEAIKAGPDYTKAVEGLKALDRYTLQIALKQRSSQFLYALAMPQTFIVPREAVEAYGRDLISHPVGTGPFRLKQYVPASKLVWERNPTYRKELYPSEGEPGDDARGLLADAGKSIPFADRVVVQIYEEFQPMWLTFMSGKLDISGIPKDNYQEAIGSDGELTPEIKRRGVVLSKTPMADITHFSFNMADPVLGKNKYLRQALSHAYDAKQLIHLFYNGRAVAAQGPIPPGLAGYDPNFKNPYGEYNVAKAKELLAKAGYPEGKGLSPVEYVTTSSSTERQFTEYAEKMFGAIGVKLKVNAYSWPEFQAAVKNKRGQLWSFAWGGDYPDAENFLQLFYSKNASPGPNDSNYSNPEFDKLYEKSLSLEDGVERTALYRRMAAMVVEDCPWIFNTHRISFTLTQPWTKNFKRHEFEHNMAKYYRVDPELRK
jgi:ABC-type transport system substrate-binding protein